MYSVMSQYLKVSEARARFGEILDAAETGAPVTIERRGVLFKLVAEKQRSRVARTALFAFVDPAVSTGQWSWKTGRRGLAFAPRRKAR
jgi:prevent-host-death family protein